MLLLASVPLAAQGPQPPAQVTASLSSATSLALNVSGYASVAFQFTGTWSGTITFEGSVDGTTYQALNATPTNSSSATTTATSNGVWTGSVGGLRYARARFSTYTSGTAVITIQAAASGGGSGGGGGGAASSVTINDPSVTTQKAAVNASGQLSITCANCSGSGASAVDNSAFTAGTTSGAPAMGFFHSTIDTVTDNSTATLGMDAKRNLFTVLRDAAGNARGVNVTAGNALTVDASATTQPVSGTVAANAGTNLNTSLLALEAGGNLAAIKAKTDNIPALGQALAASSTPVVLTAAQITTLTPPAAITGFATEATLSTLNGKVTAVNTGAVTISAALPAGNNNIGDVDVVTLPNVTIGTFPDNEPFNVAQINGVTPLMGAGATGTGAQRVNDVSSAATGAAPPASASYVAGLGSGATGGFLVGAPFCDSTVPISITTGTTTLIVTGVSGRHVYICHLDLVTAIANNVAVITGTGATCGTSTAGVFGGTTAANGWNFAANGGIALGMGIGMVGRTETTGDSICIITSAAGPLAGSIVYAIY